MLLSRRVVVRWSLMESQAPPERQRGHIGLHNANMERRPAIMILEVLGETRERLGSKSLALMRASDHEETEPWLTILGILFQEICQGDRLARPFEIHAKHMPSWRHLGDLPVALEHLQVKIARLALRSLALRDVFWI